MMIKYYYHKEKQMWCRRTKEREKHGAWIEEFNWVDEKMVIQRHLEKMAVLMLADLKGTTRVKIGGFGMIRNSSVHKNSGLIAITLYDETWRRK